MTPLAELSFEEHLLAAWYCLQSASPSLSGDLASNHIDEALAIFRGSKRAWRETEDGKVWHRLVLDPALETGE